MTEPAPAALLAGRRVLVVEDEYMIAAEIADTLDELGAETLGPVASIAAALARIAAEPRIDGALLDVSLRGEAVWPVVDALIARHVPAVLSTGYDAATIPGRYAHLPRCQKPVLARDIVRALTRMLA